MAMVAINVASLCTSHPVVVVSIERRGADGRPFHTVRLQTECYSIRGPFSKQTLVDLRTPIGRYCAAIFDAAGAKASSISRRSFTAVRLSSIATSA